tara:strand:- start:51 stop:314 length:264 start_codon:yes stop_codon:yes gene_type:complete
VVSAKDQNDAAAISIEKAHDEYGKNLCLSPSMIVMDISLASKELDAVESTHVIYTPTVLADAGMHSLSKKYSKVLKMISDGNQDSKQ